MNAATQTDSAQLARELSIRIADGFPTCGFAHLPTPLERLDRLSDRLGVNLFFKRDDQTGLAFGGNKTRKLDLIMADALAKGCNSVITWAGVQSNWCRQTVAAARKVGLKPVLVLFNRPNLPSDVDGNYFVDLLFNTDVKMVDVQAGTNIMELDAVGEFIQQAVDEEMALGNTPYVAPIGGSVTEGSMTKPLGSISYVQAFVEMMEQMGALDEAVHHIVLASGSGSTQAGLTVGAHVVSPTTNVVGISVSATKDELTECVETVSRETLTALGEPDGIADSVVVFDEYNRDGYGILNQEITDSLALVAETEGILLDPVYTAKAMTGLIDLIKKDHFRQGDNIVFLHTGGTPALFPYREQILGYLKT